MEKTEIDLKFLIAHEDRDLDLSVKAMTCKQNVSSSIKVTELETKSMVLFCCVQLIEQLTDFDVTNCLKDHFKNIEPTNEPTNKTT